MFPMFARSQPIYRDLGGGGSGGTQSSTQTASNEPWSVLQPYLEGLFKRTSALSEQPRQFFPRSTVVGFAPETEAALSGVTDRATAGSPVIGAAAGELSKTLRGDYLGRENPYTRDVIDRTIAAVRPSVDATFSSAGRYGSGLHAKSLTDNITSAIAPILYGDYEAERRNQLGAIQAAPGIAAQDYTDLTALLGVGQAREGMEGKLLGEEMARFEFPQTEPWERILKAMQIYSPGLRFGTQTTTGTTTTQQPERDPFMTLLGLGLAGAGVAGGLGWSPFASAGMGSLASI